MSGFQQPSEKLDVDTNDNSASTATIAAPASNSGVINYVTMVSGGFDAVTSGKTLILKEGSTEKLRWLVYDSLALVFPNPIPIHGAANLELEASGTAGVDGTASIAGFAR